MKSHLLKIGTICILMFMILSVNSFAETVSRNDLIGILRKYTTDEVIEESIADFDGDGQIEAFFMTDPPADDYYDRSIWFVSISGFECLYSEMPMYLGEQQRIGSMTLQSIGGKKWNELYGVKDGRAVIVECPDDLNIQQFVTDEETGVIYGVEWEWTETGERFFIYHALAFDPENYKFIYLGWSNSSYEYGID